MVNMVQEIENKLDFFIAVVCEHLDNISNYYYEK